VTWAHKQKFLPTFPTVEDYKNKSHHPARIEGGLRVNKKFQRKSEPSRPLVSIITIVHNGELTLEQTIQSVIAQTYDNVEYIIIDGNSTDKTLDILQKYEDKIAYWMSEPDQGISDAFNKGIAAATGEITGTINADDWYCSNAVELVVQKYLYNKSSIFHGKCQYWEREMKPYYVFSGRDDISYRMTINHPTVFVPRKLYDEVGLFDLSFKISMDYEWTMRAKQLGKEFFYIDSVISNMRLGGKSNHLLIHSLEEFRVRHLYKTNLIKNCFILVLILGTSLLRRILENIGLKGIVRIFRKYFSVTKKEIC